MLDVPAWEVVRARLWHVGTTTTGAIHPFVRLSSDLSLSSSRLVAFRGSRAEKLCFVCSGAVESGRFVAFGLGKGPNVGAVEREFRISLVDLSHPNQRKKNVIHLSPLHSLTQVDEVITSSGSPVCRASCVGGDAGCVLGWQPSAPRPAEAPSTTSAYFGKFFCCCSIFFWSEEKGRGCEAQSRPFSPGGREGKVIARMKR